MLNFIVTGAIASRDTGLKVAQNSSQHILKRYGNGFKSYLKF